MVAHFQTAPPFAECVGLRTGQWFSSSFPPIVAVERVKRAIGIEAVLYDVDTERVVLVDERCCDGHQQLSTASIPMAPFTRSTATIGGNEEENHCPVRRPTHSANG